MLKRQVLCSKLRTSVLKLLTAHRAALTRLLAAGGATGIGIGIQRLSDSHRVAFDGSDTMTESYSATTGTQLKYTTGYVKVNSATPVTEGPVKGVATFTIDYTI